MLLLKFSHTVPTFGMYIEHPVHPPDYLLALFLVVAAYIFYALSQVGPPSIALHHLDPISLTVNFSQSVTPAPQVEIVRNVIPDPQYFATAYVYIPNILQ